MSPSNVNSDTPVSFALEFEFVKTAIKTSTYRSRILYTGLVGCVPMHVAEVASLVYTWHVRGRVGLPDRLSPLATVEVFAGPSGGNRTAVMAGATTLPVLNSRLVLS